MLIYEFSTCGANIDLCIFLVNTRRMMVFHFLGEQCQTMQINAIKLAPPLYRERVMNFYSISLLFLAYSTLLPKIQHERMSFCDTANIKHEIKFNLQNI